MEMSVERIDGPAAGVQETGLPESKPPMNDSPVPGSTGSSLIPCGLLIGLIALGVAGAAELLSYAFQMNW